MTSSSLRPPRPAPTGERWERLAWKLLFAFLLVLYLAPLWVITYFPSQDGPSHLYNARVLTEIFDHANFMVRDVYQPNLTIFPNWTSHLLLAALLVVVPPLVAEKIFLTLAVGLIPIAFFYLLEAVHRRGFLFGWLAFLFSYNYLLFMGFYSFTLSVSLFFFGLGYWWKHRDSLRLKRLVVLYLLLLSTYFSNIVSYGLVLMAISVSAACLRGGEAVVAASRERSRRLRALLTGLVPLFRFLAYMVPAYYLFADYFLQSLGDPMGAKYPQEAWLSEYFWNVGSIVYFSNWHASVSFLSLPPVNLHHLLLWTLAAAAVVTLVYRARRREWLERRDALLLIAVLLTILFFRAPWSLGGGGFLNDRIHLFILLLAAAWLKPDMGRLFRFGFTGALVAICVLHAGRSISEHARLSAVIGELTSGVHLMEPHTTFQIRSADWYRTGGSGRVRFLSPFIHATAFYGLAARDVAHLANYEANWAFFPLRYHNKGRHLGREDYVLAWAFDAGAKFADLTPSYDLIHQTANLRMFRRKRAAGPDLSLWRRTADGRLIIHFDMQPKRRSRTAAAHHEVHRKTTYVSGGFGWRTKSPENVAQGSREIPPRDRDALWDVHDAAFQLDLPDGAYRVTNYFRSIDGGAHRVHLLANGKRIIEGLEIPAGEETIRHESTVDVTEGRLTQVIFTARAWLSPAGVHDHWIWNGLTVEQLSTP